MDVNSILVIAMIVTFMALLFTGFPIAFTLGGVAILFTLLGWMSDQFLGTVTGLDFNVLGLIVNRLFRLMNNWVMVAVPMFIIMGEMLDKSGTAEKMMRSMQTLFGPIHGGLAITVSLVGVLLAASTGIIAASVVLLGVLSLPLMQKQGYSKTLACGTVCASGTLGILIPPSIMLVIMADQLSLAVGDLLMGAVIPGCLLGSLYVCYIFIYGLIRPNALPLASDREPLSLRVVYQVLIDVLPTLGLIFVALGTIIAGICTATEASGMGAAGAIVLVAANRRLSFQVIKDATKATFNMCGYIFGVYIGATCFALVLRLLGGDEFINRALIGLHVGPYGTLAVILFSIFIMGFFLEWVEITLIILPLLGPVVGNLGIHIGSGIIDKPELIWFAVLVAINLQTSFLTPPVGFSIFFLQGVLPEGMNLKDIYKGIIPFVILQIIGLTCCIIWPKLVIWLPSAVYAR